MRLLAALLIAADTAFQLWGVFLVVTEITEFRRRTDRYGRDVALFPFTIRGETTVGAPTRSDDQTLTKKLRAEWQGDIQEAAAAASHDIKEVAALVLDLNNADGQKRALLGVQLIVAGLVINAAGSIWSIWAT